MEVSEILRLFYVEHRTIADIATALNIDNKSQVSGMVNLAKNAANPSIRPETIIAKAAAAGQIPSQEPKIEALHAESTSASALAGTAPQPPVKTGIIESIAIKTGATPTLQTAAPSTIGPGPLPEQREINVWAIDVFGRPFIGDLAKLNVWPYTPYALGEKCGDGQYEVEVYDPQTRIRRRGVETIVGHGPRRLPNAGEAMNGYGQQSQQPPAPPAQNPAETIREVAKAINEAKKDDAPKAPNPMDQVAADMGKALVEQMRKPPVENSRAMTLDDWIRAQNAQQTAHEKRMEEIRVEAAAQTAKIKAEADASIAKTKAEADASIAKAKADADIKAAQDKAHYDRMKDLDKEDRDRREIDMRKALKEASDAIEANETRLEERLTNERARDAEVNAERAKLNKEQGDRIVEVGKLTVDVMKATAASSGKSEIGEIIREAKPLLEEMVKAAKETAIAQSNPNVLNNAINNPAGVANLAGQMAGAPQGNGAQRPAGTVENVMDSQVQKALTSPDFKDFMREYCLDVENFLDAPEGTKLSVDGLLRTITSNMFSPNVEISRVWLSVAGFIIRRGWPKMKVELWPTLDDEQKKLLDDHRHGLFYATLRANIKLAVDQDTENWRQDALLDEAQRRQSAAAEAASRAEAKPEAEGGGNGKPPMKLAETPAAS